MTALAEAHPTPGQPRFPTIGMLVDGTISVILPKVGILVEICWGGWQTWQEGKGPGQGVQGLLPKENFGKHIRRPRVGMRLTMLEVVDVDFDAEDENQRIILNGEECINLTPSPLLLSPSPSQRASPAASRCLSPVTGPSPHSSPTLSAQGDPLELEPLALENGGEAQEHKAPPADHPMGERGHVPHGGAQHHHYQQQHRPPPGVREADRVAPMRKAIVTRAHQLGVSNGQLGPVLHSLDLLELQLAVLDKARELGVPRAKLTPVLQAIDALADLGPRHSGSNRLGQQPAQQPGLVRPRTAVRRREQQH